MTTLGAAWWAWWALLLLGCTALGHAQYSVALQQCGYDDFRCNNGKCIPSNQRCNKIAECSLGEDELNCPCGEDEFRCANDGSCVSLRKRCDGINHCGDNSDEANCACGAEEWQCDVGGCVPRARRCDGKVDCVADRSDETNCHETGYFRCESGRYIIESLRCNRRYDCAEGDYSDETNCPCLAEDFRCDNGFCIPAAQRCDRINHCQDRSDEARCTYGTACMAWEWACGDGECVSAMARCNGSAECAMGEDEARCPCRRGELQCRDGLCLSLAKRCNGVRDCVHGEDELSCEWETTPRGEGEREGEEQCARGEVACARAGDSGGVRCGRHCDGVRDCDGGEDEINCVDTDTDTDTCAYRCPGVGDVDGSTCLDEAMICDGAPDCADGSDEQDCYNCDSPTDFRCGNGECLNVNQRCNGIVECADFSDERECNVTNVRPAGRCDLEKEFQCASGQCVNAEFTCDGRPDCDDNSDEDNCVAWGARGCLEEEFACAAGGCIPHRRRCDNYYDCRDFSDEQNCVHTHPGTTDVCDAAAEWRCDNGDCIALETLCDRVADCVDGSDETRCPAYPVTTTSTIATTYYPTPTTSTQRYTTAYPFSTTAYPYPYPPTYRPPIFTTTPGQADCSASEWRCENGPCIPDEQRCDSVVDCPHDSSDELDCPPNECAGGWWRCENGTCVTSAQRCDGVVDCRDGGDETDCPRRHDIKLKLRTYPDEQTVSNGGDVVFQCRDEGPLRAPVRWVRAQGRPLNSAATDRKGRLELNAVTPGDAGVYICQAPKYLGYEGAQLSVTLRVESASVSVNPFRTCQPYEATCGNGDCIPKSAVCDGRVDCKDRSDEDSCSKGFGGCEPNQFECANKKCVLKTWLCDSENDCGDNSDEQACGTSAPGEPCLPTEFTCRDKQCVPKNFHCDGQNDCQDGSDEIGCAPVYITRNPYPGNVRLQAGETLTLRCEAVGVPVPLINWRLNWGHVPDKCRATSAHGKGALVCPDMQPSDSGAYSCEAINNKGTTFGAVDAIVFVNRTDVCPPGYFNSEARTAGDCIKCFCFGEATQCRSADLFVYNMPTPLGQGGTRLVGVKRSSYGSVELDRSQQINNHYYYRPLTNGATITKIQNFGGYGRGDSFLFPYLSLPEDYSGNQLTSYGGRIRFRVSPHQPRGQDNSNVPDIIIKGKFRSLEYYTRRPDNRETEIEARLVPGVWTTAGQPATREDIMMALDQVEAILIKSVRGEAGVNVTDFAMQSAEHIDYGLGPANLVEQCSCPPGYEGLSCEKCSEGYTREVSGPWLGHCRERVAGCSAGWYGAPERNVPCQQCPCPLAGTSNNFAATCALSPRGEVVCDCYPGYEGPRCERCASGYEGNPLVGGDECRVRTPTACNAAGTSAVLAGDQCFCKDNVQGRYCDTCRNGTYHLSEDNSGGCAACFCSGLAVECSSSALRRSTVRQTFTAPNTATELRVYSSAPAPATTGVAGSARPRYNAPVETSLTPALVGERVTLPDFDHYSIYYWSLPPRFAGDAVTLYGGWLRYSLVGVPRAPALSAPHVQLISENSLTFHYFGNFQPDDEGNLEASVQFLEKGWQRPDGKAVSREHFLLALADVRAVLVRGTWSPSSPPAALVAASVDLATPTGTGPPALHVEHCVCPPGYQGTSCEDCAPSYTRSESGLYLEHCGPCECNGHASMCDPETGVCYNCEHDTMGDHCEVCRPGYQSDGDGVCRPSTGDGVTTPPDCDCDPAGVERSGCDAAGRCVCKAAVKGVRCDTCREGSFELAAEHAAGCLPCYCRGVTTQCSQARDYLRTAIPAPIIFEHYGGYSITDLAGERVYSDDFVPAANESELTYVFRSPPDIDLYWSLPYTGNHILSYGGFLTFTQKFQSGGYDEESTPGDDVILDSDQYTLVYRTGVTLRSGEARKVAVPLVERGWTLHNSGAPASRAVLMSALMRVRRVLVRATLAQDLASTSIADVSMDTALRSSVATLQQAAKGIEVCRCPEGYSGTSCEQCQPDYYEDNTGHCARCQCNGHPCVSDGGFGFTCRCRPPYTGQDCSSIVGPDQTGSSTAPPPYPSPPTVSVTISGPSIKIQEIGSSVNFTCQARSTMTQRPLRITWEKEGGQLPGRRAIVDVGSGLLVLTALQPSDAGRYVCRTTDGVSTGQAHVTLQVPGNAMQAPRIISVVPPVGEYYEGSRAELQCRAVGVPAPDVTWTRAAGRPLPNSARAVGETLYIERLSLEDAGEYICIASNSAGRVERVSVVHVTPTDGARAQLTVTPPTATVSAGQDKQLAVCTGTNTVPAGSIHWIRQDGSPLPVNVQSENGVLTILGAHAEDQGVYVCRSLQPGVQPVQLLVTVTSTDYVDKPEISVLEKQVSVPQGGSKIVDCVPSGYPLPMIKWTKHQDSFGENVSQRDNALLISNAQESDAGYYMCEGSVNGEPIGQAIYIYVDVEKRSAPVVEIRPHGEQAVPLGGRFELRCVVVAGTPEPSVMWARGGGHQLSRDTEILPKDILRLNSVEVNDEGEYICTASNVAGSASASASIKVRSPPSIVIAPADYITTALGRPLVVKCRANGYPEPLVSISMLRGQEPQQLVPPTPGSAALRLDRVSEVDDGYYVCAATNAAGHIEEQFAIVVDSRGDTDNSSTQYPPDEPAQNLVAIEGETATLHCTAGEGGDEVVARWALPGGRPLPPSAQQQADALVFANVMRSDSGTYECTLVSVRSGEPVSSRLTALRVVGAPRITLEPPSQVVAPGASPQVTCRVEADDPVSVEWRPIDRPLSSRVETSGATLTFHRIEVEDAGRYQCFAHTALANASATAEVIVTDDARATHESREHEQFARAGDTVTLSCRAANTNTSWTKDERPLPRHLVNSNGSVIIRPAHKSDEGRYVCDIQDRYGRHSSYHINLHVEGVECSSSKFRCKDDSGCFEERFICDGFRDCKDFSDEEHCLLRDKRLSDDQYKDFYDYDGNFVGKGNSSEVPQLVSIVQPNRAFHVSENVRVNCKARDRGVAVTWERYGTNQYVDRQDYGEGSMLVVSGVQESDGGVYRCVGRDAYGRQAYDDFTLQVLPGPNEPANPSEKVYEAQLGDYVDMPCDHDLEQPVNIEWRREHAPLTRPANLPSLTFERVSEDDAGRYVCRVWNAHASVEARATLRVVGVVPQFLGDSWLELPPLRDTFHRANIEINFKPTENDGLVVYAARDNSGRDDYLALRLVEGVPELLVNAGRGADVVRGDRPLRLHAWHTLRLARDQDKITLETDGRAPVVLPTGPQYFELLELSGALYVGGVAPEVELPAALAGSRGRGLVGCVTTLTAQREPIDLRSDAVRQHNLANCDTCRPDPCLNDGLCQEARNEVGYECMCTAGWAGRECARAGNACRPGLCGPGRCDDTATADGAGDGYKCLCPLTHTGQHCEISQQIEFPAFTGQAFLAINPPEKSRALRMSLRVKASAPVTDGIVMYCAESHSGYGAYTAILVKDGHLEFRYDLGDDVGGTVVRANKPLEAGEWTDVAVSRIGRVVTLRTNVLDKADALLPDAAAGKELHLETPMYIGGVDDSVRVNARAGVSDGFSGCIKEVKLNNNEINIVKASNQSANVQDCSNTDRGDIPDEAVCAGCRNGGYCVSAGALACTCPRGWSGVRCEERDEPARQTREPCASAPCRNGGTCSNVSGTFKCDCPLRYYGINCAKAYELKQSVAFSGDGWLELPGALWQQGGVRAVVALAATLRGDGVLVYQHELRAPPRQGDSILVHVENGFVKVEWVVGGVHSEVVSDRYVRDDQRHEIIVTLEASGRLTLSVDGESRDGYAAQAAPSRLDSNVYLGGIPPPLNAMGLSGVRGCVEQVEFTGHTQGLDLGALAIAGRNARKCSNGVYFDVYPYLEEVEVMESPPPNFYYNGCSRLLPSVVILVSTVRVRHLTNL